MVINTINTSTFTLIIQNKLIQTHAHKILLLLLAVLFLLVPVAYDAVSANL